MDFKVIAIGNRIMKDDGIALYVLENIKSKLIKFGIKNILIGETDISYCLDYIENNDFIIIIDSSYFGKKVGDVTVYDLDEEIKWSKNYTQHDINLVKLINLYKIKNVKGYIVLIEVEDISFGVDLSNKLKSKLDEICINVFNEIITIWEENKNA